MYEFIKLLRILEEEIVQQEKLLDLLSRERAAIAKLNQEQIEKIGARKEIMLDEVRQIGDKRNKILLELVPAGKKFEECKLSDFVAACPAADVKKKLKETGAALRTTASSVHDLNETNAALIRQSLGLVSTVLSIFQSPPSSELPSYTDRGELNDAPPSGMVRGGRTLSRDV